VDSRTLARFVDLIIAPQRYKSNSVVPTELRSADLLLEPTKAKMAAIPKV